MKIKIMRVQVKLVVFATDEKKWKHKYCSHCPAINYFFGRGETISEVVNDVQSYLFRMMCHRLKYNNLKRYGWEISENSVIPPIFADKDLVRLTEQSYEEKLLKYKIIEIDVEVPNAKWSESLPDRPS